MNSIKDNINKILEEMNQGAIKAGRDPKELLLIAVTKTRTTDEINEAIDLGITDIGENKVQEILSKYDDIKPVRWHMIGHLQTNKVKYIIDKVSLIHSVDSMKLALEIDKRAKQHNKTMDILIQVNPASEDSKFGLLSNETESMIENVLESCPNIRIKGLMTIAPKTDNPEEIREYFKEMKNLYQKYSQMVHPHIDFKYLSMGMSGDFQVAIEEGANALRIGTSIFGVRNYNK
jgi:pyridoxal phosphate enzyme (YggS family)